MSRGTIVVSVRHLEPPVDKGHTPPKSGRRRRSFRADAPPKKRPHRNGDPHVVLVNTLVWKILVTRVNRKMCRSEYGGNNVRASEPRCRPRTAGNPPAGPAVGALAAREVGYVPLLVPSLGAWLSSLPAAAAPMRRRATPIFFARLWPARATTRARLRTIPTDERPPGGVPSGPTRKSPAPGGAKADGVRHLKSPVSPSAPMHNTAFGSGKSSIVIGTARWPAAE